MAHTKVRLDQYTAVLLVLRSDAPQLDAEEAAALQDAHLDFIAGLHESGHLLAAGPLFGDNEFRGLSILRVGPEEARRLTEQDPMVTAGRFALRIMPWFVPAGAATFSPTRFPHSAAEVEH